MKPIEKTKIKDFRDICNRLSAHRFFNETNELKIKLDKGGKGQHSLDGYDEDLLKSFLMDFRKILMNDEPTNFFQIVNILWRNNYKLQHKIESIRSDFSDRHRKSPILLETPNGKKENIVDIWLNGKYFHEDNKIKKDLIKDISALQKQVFITTVFDLSQLAIELSNLIEDSIPQKNHKNQKKPSPSKEEINKVYGLVRGQELGDIAKKLTTYSTSKSTELTRYEQIRIFLFGAGLLYEKSLSSEILGNHEIHLIYAYREKINMFPAESWLVFKTIISDKFDQKTGWYWYPKLTKNSILNLTTKYFIESTNTSVRIGVINYLDKFWSKRYLKFLEILSTDDSKDVKEMVIEILKKHQHKENLRSINILLKDKDEDIRKKAFELQINTLITHDFRKALSFLKENPNLDDFYIKNLPTLLRKLAKTELDELIALNHQSLRIFANKELLRRKALSEEKIEKLLRDKQWEVRYYALQNLLSRGKTYNPSEIRETLKSENKEIQVFSKYMYGLSNLSKDDLLHQIYENKTSEELEPLIEWTTIEAPMIYEILNRKTINKSKKDVRKDLETSFKDKRELWLGRAAVKAEVSLAEMEKIYAEYDNFIIEQFNYSALRLLFDFGSSKDLSVAKRNLSSSKYQTKQICIRIIRKFGYEKDSLYLLEVAEKERLYDSDAVIGALLLDKHGKYKIHTRILESANYRHIKIALAFAQKFKKQISQKIIGNLLASESDDLRVCTVAYLNETSTRKELIKILEEYVKKDYYYYNVVCWLDRILYSPPLVRKSFSNKLKDLLNKELVEGEIISSKSPKHRLYRRYFNAKD